MPQKDDDRKIKLQRSEDYYIKVLLQETKVKDIMTRDPVSLPMDAPFSQVSRKIMEFGIRHLPIVDKENRLVGLITQRDLYKIQPPRKMIDGTWYYDEEALNSVILSHVMIKEPFTMSPENSVGEALLTMVNAKYGCIPVVDEDRKLRGIVTQIDILRVAAQIFLE
ncbi:MAG: CBS domain-containing protein [Candidatus Omnitrophota bacterium]